MRKLKQLLFRMGSISLILLLFFLFFLKKSLSRRQKLVSIVFDQGKVVDRKVEADVFSLRFLFFKGRVSFGSRFLLETLCK